MAPTKALSPTEWRIMRCFWRRGSATIAAVLEDLTGESPIVSFKTAHTLITRLVGRGYLTVENAGRRPLYFAAAPRQDEAVRAAAQYFVDTVIAGEPTNVRILEEVLAERQARLRN